MLIMKIVLTSNKICNYIPLKKILYCICSTYIFNFKPSIFYRFIKPHIDSIKVQYSNTVLVHTVYL